jgi:hypothetical protein
MLAFLLMKSAITQGQARNLDTIVSIGGTVIMLGLVLVRMVA